MNRKKSIVKLSFIIGALIVMLVFTFLQAGNVNNYMGFAGAIVKNMGAQSQGGVVLVYKAEETETDSKASYKNQINARLYLMRVALSEDGQNLISNYEKQIARQGSNKIRVETLVMTSVNSITAAAEKNTQIMFVANGNEIAGGDIITNVKFATRLQSYIIEIEITDEGKKDLEENSASTISLIDKAAKDAGKEESEYKIIDFPADAFTEGKLSGNKIVLTDSSSAADALNVKYMKILAGSRPLRLTLISADTISKERADNQALLSLIAGIAAAVVIIAFLIIRYKMLGLSAAASMLAYLALMVFFAAVLPFSQLSFLGINMITLIMLLNAGSYVFGLESVREEYRKGKTVQASVASGSKNAFWPLFDVHLFALIAGFALWVLGEGALVSAGMIIFFAAILSMGAVMLCRYLISLIISISGDELKPSLMGLSRGKGFKEGAHAADGDVKTQKPKDEVAK